MRRQDSPLWVATFAALVNSRGIEEAMRIADLAYYSALYADSEAWLDDDPEAVDLDAEVRG